jgi:hypothetical protein
MGFGHAARRFTDFILLKVFVTVQDMYIPADTRTHSG